MKQLSIYRKLIYSLGADQSAHCTLVSYVTAYTAWCLISTS